MKAIVSAAIAVLLVVGGGLYYIGHTQAEIESQQQAEFEARLDEAHKEYEIDQAEAAAKARKIKGETAKLAAEVEEIRKERDNLANEIAERARISAKYEERDRIAKEAAARRIADKRKSTQTTRQTSTKNPNPVCSQSQSKARLDIKTALTKKYDGHYSTINMLLEANMEAYDKLCHLTMTEPGYKVLKNLNDRYYPHFSTILMLYESNMKAYENLNQ
jgi:chromosome segregation ATPase